MFPVRVFKLIITLTALNAAALLAGEGPVAGEGVRSNNWFFENKIRPVLADNCYKCHSVNSEKLKAKLRVDSRAALLKGGDTGPAIVVKDASKSLLLEAMLYKNKDLEMPPDGKLSEQVLQDFKNWINGGAYWPDEPEPKAAAKAPEIDVEKARREHWAFQPIQDPKAPMLKNPAGVVSPIDAFVQAKLEEKGITAAPLADKNVLLRRAYFDLIGLPPTPEDFTAFNADNSADAFAKVVDRLLESRHFGERWGRHWLDLARYAESSGGGRIRAFENAWRYRDYVINAFNSGKPFDQFIREQIAGDLLPHNSPAQRSEQITATGFLALGPKNLDTQDKELLRMDVIDEQLDTTCRVFLGLTPGCARCHDHKFDPLPTREYYSLSGIFRSTKTLTPGNVSGFVEQPLNADAAQEAATLEYEKRVGELETAIRDLKHEIDTLNAGTPGAEKVVEKKELASKKKIETRKLTKAGLENLPGVVVDDDMAQKIGEWIVSTSLPNYIGEGYVHDGHGKKEGKGKCSLVYTAALPKAGVYEVRFSYTANPARARAVPLTVKHSGGETKVLVDERNEPLIDHLFVSLGRFTFDPATPAAVTLTNAGTDGVVTADAVQFLPAEDADAKPEKIEKAEKVEKSDPPVPQVEVASVAATPLAAGDPRARKKVLEAQLKELKAKAPKSAMAISVRDEAKIEDAALFIRGDVHKAGDIVPRGFLSLAGGNNGIEIPKNQSGRVQFAEWLVTPRNPLTARVMVNRVWQHLFGVGLVRSSDNFGLAGEAPIHTQLIDHLASDFMSDGWSVKKLIRSIMLTRTYQQSCGDNAACAKADPENRLFWRMNRRRLEAEAIRDSILFTSGKLDFTPGQKAMGKYDQTTRRSVYVKALREDVDDCFDIFDGADYNLVVGNRASSNLATQALFLLNSPFVVEQSRAAAERMLAEAYADDAARINAAYWRTLGRAPRQIEVELAKKFLDGEGKDGVAAKKAWAALYQAWYGCLDFRYVN